MLDTLSKTADYLQAQDFNIGGVEDRTNVDENGFSLKMDAQHFHPEEIAVETKDNTILVRAKHVEHRDNRGFESSEFMRQYVLPEGFNLDEMTSNLSSDGILSIECPPADGNNYLRLERTGPPKLRVKNDDEFLDDEEEISDDDEEM